MFSTLEVEEAVVRIVEGVLSETRQFAKTGKPAKRAQTDRKNAHRVQQIAEKTKYILAREYCSNLSLAGLSERIHCSPGYLSRCFTRATGFTLHAYQQQLRLRASLQFIAQARFDGAGVAAQLGFASHSHFTSMFRRAFGITPTEFVKSISLASLRRLQSMLDLREQMALAGRA